jgi:hypothetical protein
MSSTYILKVEPAKWLAPETHHQKKTIIIRN